MLLPPINIADVIAYVQYGGCYCHKADMLPFVLGMRYFLCEAGVIAPY